MVKKLILAILLVVTPVVLSQSCKTDKRRNPIPGGNISFRKPINQEVYILKSVIPIELGMRNAEYTPDSIQIFANNNLITTMPKGVMKSSWKADENRIEVVRLSFKAHYPDGRSEQKNADLLLISDVEPEHYTYRVVNTFPHDTAAYTQGLFYAGNNILYESTGRYGLSELRKTNLLTGKVINSVKLPDNIFGEGMTIVNDKIIQLSWKENTVFFYKKDDLSLINKKPYKYAEGWGLTWNEKHLIMSDGSSKLYFIDPENFQEVSRQMICDNKRAILYINEMEYIRGEVWANIYTSNIIVRINPESGKVLGYIDLSGILPKSDYNKNTDYLNGIAWDSENDRIFVTGKCWPKLFEIEVIKR